MWTLVWIDHHTCVKNWIISVPSSRFSVITEECATSVSQKVVILYCITRMTAQNLSNFSMKSFMIFGKFLTVFCWKNLVEYLTIILNWSKFQTCWSRYSFDIYFHKLFSHLSTCYTARSSLVQVSMLLSLPLFITTKDSSVSMGQWST